MKTLSKTTWKALDSLTGGLGKPGKMPCRSWGIPAILCKVGAKLAKVSGTPCSECYACKGNYAFDSVQVALWRRFHAWRNDAAAWIRAMAASIDKTGDAYFRWFDSGDIYSADMLRDIFMVAALTPAVRHWLPTQERRTVLDVGGDKGEEIPDNMLIRFSATLIDGVADDIGAPRIAASRVHTDRASGHTGVFYCPSRMQENECGDCRVCWAGDVRIVSYALH